MSENCNKTDTKGGEEGEVSEDLARQAEQLKNKANDFFKGIYM